MNSTKNAIKYETDQMQLCPQCNEPIKVHYREDSFGEGYYWLRCQACGFGDAL